MNVLSNNNCWDPQTFPVKSLLLFFNRSLMGFPKKFKFVFNEINEINDPPPEFSDMTLITLCIVAYHTSMINCFKNCSNGGFIAC